jgi:hypothetical protein
MHSPIEELETALQNRNLTSLTGALRQVANRLGYQLKSPYTEVTQLKAEEEGNRFLIRFTAKLYVHYSSTQLPAEGLVFTVQFGGEANSDSQSPPVQELFSAGTLDSLVVYGYRTRWSGQTFATPELFVSELEVPSRTLNRIPIELFLKENRS